MTTLYDERKKGRKVATDAAYLPEIEPPAKGRRIIADKHPHAPKGFALRVTKRGNKAFVLRYVHTGKERLLTIGEWPTWTLTAAREKAKTYRHEIDSGHDLLDERRAERSDPTVADVAERFIRAKRRGGMKSVDDIESLFRLYLLPAMAKEKITAIRRRDVIALVEGVADKAPRQASLLLSYVKQMVAWAEDREIVEANPVATLRADKISSALAYKPRARVLDADEIKAFWNNAEAAGIHRLTALALKLVLVTGQRSGEVAGMCWSEVQGRTWTLPAARRKTGQDHAVPMTDTAMEILEAAREEVARLRKRRKTEASDYVFETRPDTPLTTAAMSRAVARQTHRIGAKETSEGVWRPHDLRRTCRTGLAAAGVSETVAELVIGHARQGIAAVYDQHRYDKEKRAALEAWERRLLRISEGRTADNVVSLARTVSADS